MRANPLAGRSTEDVESVCREHGVLCGPPRGGGSHDKVGHPRLREKLAVPFRRPIKPVHIRKLVDLIDAVGRLS